MINESTAIIRALKAIGDVFGIEYLRDNLNCPMVRCMDNGVFKFSCLFADSKKRPDLTPDYLGWTVYATVDVDMETGEATMVDYVLPDGTKMKK